MFHEMGAEGGARRGLGVSRPVTGPQDTFQVPAVAWT